MGLCWVYIAGFMSSGVTISIPIAIGDTLAVSSVTITGAQVVAAGILGASILTLQRPDSGRIRFNDGTGIDPSTGKDFKNADDARNYYKSIKDPKMKNNWKTWLKGKGWYRNHLR